MNSKQLFLSIIFCVSAATAAMARVDSVGVRSDVSEVYHYKPGNYDPVRIIEVSNRLMQLSENEIFAIVRSVYEEEDGLSSGYGLFLLLQLTFDVSDSSEYPEIMWGVPNVTEPVSPTARNRFPLLLVDGFPVLLPGGYALSGVPDFIERHIDFYISHGELRSEPYSLDCKCGLEHLKAVFRKEWEMYFGTAISATQIERYVPQFKAILRYTE